MKVKILILLIFLISYLSATIISVPQDQPTIQAGIDASTDADTVLVQPGTYFENINFNGKNITVASLFITTQDTSYISQTIIDGSQNGIVVIFENEEHLTTLLCGFTITNGYSYHGGGIKCRDHSSPSLRYLIISNNSSLYSGGGLHCKDYSSPEMEDITIKNNSASMSAGGGIYCSYDSNLHIKNVKILDNSADIGGGIYYYESNPIIKNSIIAGNTASSYGGGIYISQSNPTIEKTLIVNNTANKGGGICSYSDSNTSLLNTTISDNFALASGGGIFCVTESNPHIVNCILWNNLPEEIYFSENGGPNVIFIEYSDIEGGEPGIITNYNAILHWLDGNIDTNPLFVDQINGDYHLTEYSPCIDAGDPTYPFDPDGTIVDMGAYYYHQESGIYTNQLPIIKTQITNYPNPFNPITTISFSIQQESDIELKIYNLKGQKVKQLINDKLSVGQHSAVWNGEDEFVNRIMEN